MLSESSINLAAGIEVFHARFYRLNYLPVTRRTLGRLTNHPTEQRTLSIVPIPKLPATKHELLRTYEPMETRDKPREWS